MLRRCVGEGTLTDVVISLVIMRKSHSISKPQLISTLKMTCWFCRQKKGAR